MTWLRAIGRVVRTAFAADPWRAAMVFTFLPLFSLSQVLGALWLKMLIDGLKNNDAGAAGVAIVLVATSIVVTHVVMIVMSKVRFTLQERTSLHFERELLAMVAALPGIEHHERPEYLDKIQVLQEQRAAFSLAVGAIVMNIGVLLQAAGTGILLLRVSPLLLLLPVLNLISFVTDARGGSIMVAAAEDSAADVRLAREHFDTATRYSFSKEVRVFGLADEMLGRHRRAAEAARTKMVRAAVRGAAWDAFGGFIAVAAHMAALAFVVYRAQHGQATLGDVVMTMRLTSMLSITTVRLSGTGTGAIGRARVRMTAQSVRRYRPAGTWRRQGFPAAAACATRSRLEYRTLTRDGRRSIQIYPAMNAGISRYSSRAGGQRNITAAGPPTPARSPRPPAAAAPRPRRTSRKLRSCGSPSRSPAPGPGRSA